MKKTLIHACILFILLFCKTIFAGPGLFFDISATGNHNQINIILCLNGKGPLTCQNYIVNGTDLTIRTTVPKHTYTIAGIKINTPGYTPQNCTPISNGYCLFSVSDTKPANIFISNNHGYTIGGNITGLTSSGLTLQNNGGDNLSLPTDATLFQFSTPVSFDGHYHVRILKQPTGLTCTLANESGSSIRDNVSNIHLTCNKTIHKTKFILTGVAEIAGFRNPILYTSTDGISWSDPIILPSPTGATSFSITSLACDNQLNNCIAYGSATLSGIVKPLTIKSIDNGKTWGAPQFLTLPSDGLATSTTSIACGSSGLVCVAIGRTSIAGVPKPLAYTTLDGGVNWSNPVLPSPPGLANTFIKLSCDASGFNCIATGSSNIAGVKAVIYKTADGGNTWSSAIVLPLTNGTNHSIQGIACEKSLNRQCVILGSSSINGTTRRWTYITADAGSTWGDYNLFSIPPLSALLTFTAISCGKTGLPCMTAGFYYNEALENAYLISTTSINGGKTWSNYIPATQPAGNHNSSMTFNHSNCNGTGLTCIAAGNAFFDEVTVQGVSYISYDGGNSWDNGTRLIKPLGATNTTAGLAVISDF